jgi:hypothetical protein
LLAYLVLAGKGDAPPDLITLIDADTYFQARHITASAEQVEELARTLPTDLRKQVAQLLALRWLGDHRVEAARGALMAIADGRLAQDEYGFARDYARRALARLDGKSPAQVSGPGKDLRAALQWFPEDAESALGLDLRTAWADRPFKLKTLGSFFRSDGRAGVPLVLDPSLLNGPSPLNDGNAENLYRWVERVGNIEIDTIVAVQLVPTRLPQEERAVFRFTGRGNWIRLIENLRPDGPPSPAQGEQAGDPPDGHGCGSGAEPWVVSWQRGPAGESITLLRNPGQGTTFCLVGERDVIVASDQDGRERDSEIIEQVLQVRAGRSAALPGGRLAAELDELPDGACAFWAGKLSEAERQSPVKQDALPVAPRRIVGYAAADKDKGIHVRFRAHMATAEEAESFVQAIQMRRQQQIEEVDKLKPNSSAEVVTRTLESIRTEAEGVSVSGDADIPGDFPEALGEVVELTIGWAVGMLVAGAFETLVYIFYALVAVVALIAIAGVVLVVVLALRAGHRRADGSRLQG